MLLDKMKGRWAGNQPLRADEYQY
ncbi:hypothetical protein FMEAI12_2840054 [Parafrankia sp. Ea1.12]|nr:hypothetical protein FMEAI12_2840054 [Parafrankia sp. Ea1.12]